MWLECQEVETRNRINIINFPCFFGIINHQKSQCETFCSKIRFSRVRLFVYLGAVGGDEATDEDKEKAEEEERERQEAIREAEERRKEKHRKMEEEREKMRQEIRDKVSRRIFLSFQFILIMC